MLSPYEIRELRKRYGLTQKELSLLLGWGSVTMSRYRMAPCRMWQQGIRTGLYQPFRKGEKRREKCRIQTGESVATETGVDSIVIGWY